MRALIAIHPLINFTEPPISCAILFREEGDAVLEVENFDEVPNVDKIVSVRLSRKEDGTLLWSDQASRYLLGFKPFLVWRDLQEDTAAEDRL